MEPRLYLSFMGNAESRIFIWLFMLPPDIDRCGVNCQ